MNKNLKTAIFGGGCFWCTEAIFSRLKGVKSVTSGYAGGVTDNPDYSTVSTGSTHHAEVVKIEFDPETISYPTLLEVFFATHNPTTKNRQGADIGTQYRSIILFTTPTQKEKATKMIKKLNNSERYKSPIVTEVQKLKNFFTAEEYHQKYFDKNENKPYCKLVIGPKLKKLEEQFEELLK